MTAATLEAPAEITEAERNRLAARRDKKRQIAQLQLQQKRYEELLAEYNGFNARIDAATSEHQDATRKIQETLLPTSKSASSRCSPTSSRFHQR